MEKIEKDRMREVWAEIHGDIPREGPGDAESTRRAYSMVQLPPHPQILDVGCGPGMQTLELARLSDGSITALDYNKDFLTELEGRATAENVADRIKTVQGSMFSLPFRAESFDLIWSEGAIFIIGFKEGLTKWRPLLKDSGHIAVSHLSWLKEDVPEKPRKFWSEAFPQITSVEENLKILKETGYEAVCNFTLPESAWWDDYYEPFEKKLSPLREKYKGDSAALARIEKTQREIDLYRNYSDYYGYVFYIAKKAT